MGANKDPSSNVKCRSVLYLAPGTRQMATEKLPYVDARPGLTAGAASSTVRPPMATGSQSCVSLLRAAASQPRDSPELWMRGSWARGAQGRRHRWELASEMIHHLLSSSSVPSSFAVVELGPWAACLMARPAPRRRVGTALG